MATMLAVIGITAGSCSSPTPRPTRTGTDSAYGAECTSFAPDPSDAFYTPMEPYTDPAPLEIATSLPADAGLDQARLDRAAENAALAPDIASLLVMRHGKLVFERYFSGGDASRANNVASVSKSILALVTGIAIDEGHLRLDSRIDEFLPADLVGAHGDLTVENLLTMSAGLRLDDTYEYAYDEASSGPPGDRSFVRAVLARDSIATPGTEFEYSTGLTQVLAAVVSEATGQSLCQYAADRLLGPLGIDVEKWWVEPGGYDSGGHSLFITPREIARFGQLVLQRGMWEGRRLVPAAWLDQALTERWDLGCRGIHGLHMGYGLLWWLYEVDGLAAWNASGFGGQELWIVPDLDLLVLITQDTSGDFSLDNPQIAPAAIIRAAIVDGPVQTDRPDRCPHNDLRPFTISAEGGTRAAIQRWPIGALPTSWSGDGTRVAIASDVPDLNPEIYLASVDGSTDLVRLTRDLAFDGMPQISPDGSTVAFVRGAPGSTDLYLVDADGANLRQLTGVEGFEESPTWSPDGTQLAFAWGQDAVGGFGEGGELWAIDVASGQRRLLLGQHIASPQWSPDGTRIALELRDGEEARIGVLELATGALTDLGPGFFPHWSPDGTRLAFVGGADDVFDIYVMDADGSDLSKVTDDAAFDTLPLWSPDGQTILFVSAEPQRP